MISWNAVNLDHHFTKRIKNDPDCMEDIFQKPVNQIEKNDYEQESISVISMAWLAYEASQLDPFRSTRLRIAYHPKRSYFIDHRLLKTVVSHSQDVVTCFHEHFGRPHKREQYEVEQKFKYLEELAFNKKAGKLREINIRRLEKSSLLNEVFKLELEIFSAIPTIKVDVE